MQATRDGPVPVGELILEEEGKHHEVALWREAALAELALLLLTEITHLNIVRNQRKKQKRDCGGWSLCGKQHHSPFDRRYGGAHRSTQCTDQLIKRLPIIVNISYEGGVICSIDSPAFTEA
ncbi:hypothetical protein AMEX_G5984 [Astyanax mexicanus]|uniref:Uncharacterized protein n=1 Tax=Astyanax mexicanus TaxID=7994 RepID=A0A8T2M518_ASTMX|nr:hypothetical protein AMEX_G5984 [Astyanax mexicanus]